MKTIPVRTAAPPPAAGQPRGWRLAWLFAAPHRLAFAAGALMLATSGAWWAAVMTGRLLGLVATPALPPTIVHGLWMALGFMPLFFAGFLFTAGPKWLGLPAVDARSLRGPVAAQLAGWLVLLIAAQVSNPVEARVLGGLGVGAATVGWSAIAWRFAMMVRRSRAPDRVHAAVIAGAGAIGALAFVVAAVALASGDFHLVRLATLVALWGFIGIVYVAVAHRMIPFFSASALPVLDAWRPMWLLTVLVATLALQGGFAVAEALVWPLPTAWQLARAALEAVFGVGVLALALRWGLVQSLKVRLLAMLHIGFFWLGIAFVLSAASHVLGLIGDRSLGLAPLHAYTMGFLGSTLIAMATRVSAGHGGRTLAADGVVWALFWALQAAVMLRIAGAVATPLGWPATPILTTASLLWAAVVIAWALRYGRWYGQPRIDGRPG